MPLQDCAIVWPMPAMTVATLDWIRVIAQITASELSDYREQLDRVIRALSWSQFAGRSFAKEIGRLAVGELKRFDPVRAVISTSHCGSMSAEWRVIRFHFQDLVHNHGGDRHN